MLQSLLRDNVLVIKWSFYAGHNSKAEHWILQHFPWTSFLKIEKFLPMVDAKIFAGVSLNLQRTFCCTINMTSLV